MERDDLTDSAPKLQPTRRSGVRIFLLVGFAVIAGLMVYGIMTEKPRSAQQASTSTKPETKPTETKAEYEQRVLAEQRARDRVKQIHRTPDPTLLEIVHTTWEKGGFDSVAIWRVEFFNRGDKPIGNIRYRTRYTAETGDQVDRGGIDALLGDYTIRRVIPPHQKRQIEINDGFLHHEAVRGSFEVVSWEFVNPP
jgi:hypothetical protein